LLKADEDDWYGYGWWVGSTMGPWEFSAEGRGGQTVMIYPDLDLMVVTTGAGFSYSEAGELVGAAIPDMSGDGAALPPNPAGFTKLTEALTTIRHSPDRPEPVHPLPAAASAVTGKTFIFDGATSIKGTTSSMVESLRLDFDGSAQAHIEIKISGEDSARAGLVGLDGVYRTTPSTLANGLPEAFRGGWRDERTFSADYYRIGESEQLLLTMRFGGEMLDEVLFEARESGLLIVKAEGRAQSP
jgi:hypothetical protein